MKFYEALKECIENGAAINRPQEGCYIVVKNGNFLVCFGNVVGTCVCSEFTHEDLLADDWQIVDISSFLGMDA